MTPLVDAAAVKARLAGLVVVDARFKLGEPGAGERGYLAGHIPGAAFLDLDRDLADPPGERGRHPLPDTERFQAAARRAGISNGSSVVAYDQAGEGGAARLWWLLRHHGHANVAVLDGGLGAWVEAGGDLSTTVEPVEPGDFVVRPGDLGVAALDEVAGAPLLLDARAPERYRGEVEPIDPVAGHIPGARNLPFADLAPQGKFRSPEELRRRFAEVGAGDADAVAYCGSGVTAAVLVLAAEAAGIRAPRLYPGSWSEWSRRGLPAA